MFAAMGTRWRWPKIGWSRRTVMGVVQREGRKRVKENNMGIVTVVMAMARLMNYVS